MYIQVYIYEVNESSNEWRAIDRVWAGDGNESERSLDLKQIKLTPVFCYSSNYESRRILFHIRNSPVFELLLLFRFPYSIALQMSFVIISFVSKKLFNLKEKETRFKSRIFSNLFLHMFFIFLMLFSITKFLDRFEDYEIILEMLLEINSRFTRVAFNVPFFRVKFRAAWPYPSVIGNT